jgi:hypothetical protein
VKVGAHIGTDFDRPSQLAVSRFTLNSIVEKYEKPERKYI